MKAKRRWRREGDGRLVIGDHDTGAVVIEIWEGRYAGKTVVTAWRPYRGRHVFMPGRRYFPSEKAGTGAVSAWLSRHSTPKRPHAAGKGGS